MDILIAAPGDEERLAAEVRHSLPGSEPSVGGAGWIQVDALPIGVDSLPAHLFFCRQWLPNAIGVHAPSIREWTDAITRRVVGVLPDGQPWRFVPAPHYGAAGAGLHRVLCIATSLREQLRRRRRHLLRTLRTGTAPFLAEESLAQALLLSPDTGWVSVAQAPLPCNQPWLITPFPKGEIAPAVDKAAPSRAFTKLVEAEARVGLAIRPGDSCVDLGAAPGSWTYVARQRGARVVAVDRAPLRDDLARDPAVTFHRGDAFRFAPAGTVDWLLCDVIAPAEATWTMLRQWITRGWCRRFIVTLKLRADEDLLVLDEAKQFLAARCRPLLLRRLCANKNEVCLAGAVVPATDPAQASTPGTTRAEPATPVRRS